MSVTALQAVMLSVTVQGQTGAAYNCYFYAAVVDLPASNASISSCQLPLTCTG
jgi:hypothetical protein